MSWEELQFSEKKVVVTNIIIEPTNTATYFVVYGKDENQFGFAVGLDFSSLHKRKCKGVNDPDVPSSDYEKWSPSDTGSSNCLLGRKIFYSKRKRESQCFNGEEFERKTFVHNCQCTEEDWECDLDSFRTGDGPCVPFDKISEDEKYKVPEICDKFYYVSQGYLIL